MRKPAFFVASLLVAGALAAGAVGTVAAEEDSFADHPLTGTWLAMANPPLPENPQVAAPSYFGADGSVLLMFPLSQVGPGGVQFNSAGVGTWEPDGERRGHFTVVQALSDANGTYLGTVLFEGYPEVSADGQSFGGDTPQRVVVRDATNNITFDEIIPMEPEVTGTRIGATVESVVFPAPSSPAGTPAP